MASPRRLLSFLVLLLLAAAGCSERGHLGPERAGARPGATLSETFVLESPSDSRLPGPGLEAAAATPDDRALFARLTAWSVAPRNASTGDASVFWNRLTTELAAGAGLPPPRFSRAYALVHVAIFDAAIAAGDRRNGLPRHALAAGAASRVLAYLFPTARERIDEAAASELALDSKSSASFGAWSLGRAVGRLAVKHGEHDGSDAPFTGTIPNGDGIWTGTNPVLPTCGTWKPWILASGSEIQPDPPYAFGSREDLADVQEVYEVSLHRTAEQIAIAQRWAAEAPPAIWNGYLEERVASHGMDFLASARAFAYLNIAMADGFISCWESKYTYWIARPFQRIPGLVTVVPTPNFPTYTSGHSTISAAAAVVLGAIFPSERSVFVAGAEEAALSRLYGGIHFRHDNEQGLVVGRMIGERVVDRMRSRTRFSLATSG